MSTKRYQNLLYKDLSYQIQGAAIEVRKNFGSGFKETIYQNAFAEELKARNIKFDKEKSIQIFSPKTGKLIGSYRPDFIVEDKILIELKAVEKIPKMFLDQTFSYLRNSKYELGYFINFVSPKLYIKRLIFTNDRKPFIAKLLVSISLIFALFSVLPAIGQAAELNLISQTKEIGVGQQFQVDLFLDTKNEEINAVEGKIVLPENLLEVKEIRDGNSIVNFWIEKPKASNGEILFSGIIPGGYLGERGLIFSIVFQSKKEGEGTIEIVKARTLLNDGKGTEAPLTISNFQFSVTHELPRIETPIDTKKDTEPPETFRPEIAKDESMFDGKWFLVFATQDKSAGIADYAIHETTRRKHELTPTGEITPIATKIDEKDWILAESPYLLKDQKLRSYIYVKAVDKAGNERIEMLSPQKPLAWYENYLIWVIIIIGLIIACLIYLIGQNLWRRKITRHE